MIRMLPALLLLVMVPWAAAAEGPRSADVISAESERALALAQDGKLDEAVVIWVDILDEVSPQGRADVHVNLAVAYQALSRLPEAWFHLDAYLTEAPKEDEAVAAERAAIEQELATTHVPLRFSCPTAGTRLFLTVDRTQAYPCPLRWWFPRGDEGQIFADAPGQMPGATPIRAQELDRDRMVIVRLEPTPSEAPPGADVPPPGADVPVVEEQAAATGAAWKWSLLGGGLGVVAAGAILQVVAYNRDQDLRTQWDPTGAPSKDAFDSMAAGYSRDYDSDVRPMVYGSYALYGIGGAAAATGLVFLIMDWTQPDAESAVHVAPLAAPEMFGLTLAVDL